MARYERHYYVYSAYEAILREKQIKRWRREKKLELIWAMNPKGEDLGKQWEEGRVRT